MGFEFDAPEEGFQPSGANFLEVPGVYHLVIKDLDDSPTKSDGSLLSAFRVTVAAIEGTPKNEDGSFAYPDATTKLTFFYPNISSKDGGKFAKKKIFRFLVAAGLMKPTDKKFTGELSDAVGSQVIAKLEYSDDSHKYLDLAYSDIWHVDDPEAANYPRDEAAIKELPASLRCDPSLFPSAKKKATPPKTNDEVGDI